MIGIKILTDNDNCRHRHLIGYQMPPISRKAEWWPPDEMGRRNSPRDGHSLSLREVELLLTFKCGCVCVMGAPLKRAIQHGACTHQGAFFYRLSTTVVPLI